jgi:hypothetical protein
MDTRRSYYLAARQDDFDVRAPDEDLTDFTDVPYVIPANDNTRTKDRPSARCAPLLRRLFALHPTQRP